MADTTTTNAPSFASKYNPSLHHTALRIKDPEVSLPFYQKHFGMTLVKKFTADDGKGQPLSHYFLMVLEPGITATAIPGEPDSRENEKFLWSLPVSCLHLLHYPSAKHDPDFKYNNGNVEPHRGFGHLGFCTDDVYVSSAKLEEDGVKFQKRPDEGRMKGVAFALDPDGYWIEIAKRGEGAHFSAPYNYWQTMLRVKDPAKSIPFYRDVLGMTPVGELKFSDYTLHFLASLPKELTPPKFGSQHSLWDRVVEFTHNHGTETDPSFSYHNGNDKPEGFGQLGFLIDDIEAACAELEKLGFKFYQKYNEGPVRTATLLDPDNYHIRFIARGETCVVKT